MMATTLKPSTQEKVCPNAAGPGWALAACWRMRASRTVPSIWMMRLALLAGPGWPARVRDCVRRCGRPGLSGGGRGRWRRG
jgi:hypothetical protein